MADSVASAAEEVAYDAEPVLKQEAVPNADKQDCWTWTPMWRQSCGFGAEEFSAVMQNLVRNPNLLSSWLFRADILAESTSSAAAVPLAPAAFPNFAGFARADERTIVRRLIPRNTLRDEPMLQTCLFYESASQDDGGHGAASGPGDRSSQGSGSEDSSSLVVYLPHVTGPGDVPFYHPKVRGVGFMHEWQPMTSTGSVSIHFSLFPSSGTGAAYGVEAKKEKMLSRPVLSRVALNLINTVHKHGEGKRSGYVKRVHHDRLVPQARVQDRYTCLKEKYARQLVQTWQETTDPTKHVFEDLSIAAFLLELWADMYGVPGENRTVPSSFPGFVDVGCGNGLLVYILNEEGYNGWGFDARKRRSWSQYGNGEKPGLAEEEKSSLLLRECLLLPFFLRAGEVGDESATVSECAQDTHDGRFPPGTFIIANHADELTAWAPVLAALSGCPFLAIPCCSHNFSGAKFRAPPPSSAARKTTASVSVSLASSSTYASFVEWVAEIAKDCDWKVEFEMLRIPSTRNAALLGRHRQSADGTPQPNLTTQKAMDVVTKYGGAHGFADAVAKLATKKASH